MAASDHSESLTELSARPWDVIVIGSGLGGLTAATLLAKHGKRVLILEKHYTPGGFTHTFERKGYEWDVGVHYVGQVHDPKAPLRKIFDYMSEGQLSWASVGALYDRAIIGGDVYDFCAGVELQIKSLVLAFPDEEAAIRRYYELVQSTAARSSWFFGEKTMPFWLSRLVGRFLRRPFESRAVKSTLEVISSLTTNQRLIAVLSAQCGDYGLPPGKGSFGIHAIVVDHYLKGATYPHGGAKSIHATILAHFRRNGGVLALNASVARVAFGKGRAVGVEMASGQTILAPVVISNAGAWNTFQKLTPAKDSPSFCASGSTLPVNASASHVCLYVGLDGSDAELRLPKHNLWIYDNYEFDKSYAASQRDPALSFPMTYISFPSAKDPDWAAGRPGKATVQVIAPLPFAAVEQWEGLPWRRRGKDYALLKARMTAMLTAKLLEAVPQLAGRIAYSELSTPLSTKHFAGYQKGEIYGLEHTPDRFRLKFLRPQTRIKGLFLTGQDIVTVGVGGAVFSGVLTATKVLNKSMILRILWRGYVWQGRAAR